MNSKKEGKCNSSIGTQKLREAKEIIHLERSRKKKKLKGGDYELANEFIPIQIFVISFSASKTACC